MPKARFLTQTRSISTTPRETPSQNTRPRYEVPKIPDQENRQNNNNNDSGPQNHFTDQQHPQTDQYTQNPTTRSTRLIHGNQSSARCVAGTPNPRESQLIFFSRCRSLCRKTLRVFTQTFFATSQGLPRLMLIIIFVLTT